MTAADPAKVETAIKDLVPLLKERLDNSDAPDIEFNFDTETHEGVRFHEIKIAFDHEPTRNVIGMIKKGMAAKGKTEFDSEFNFRVAPFLKFLGRLPDAPEQLEIFAEQLTENGGDLIRAYGKYIPNGSFSRFELQDGLLSLIKSAQDVYENANGF